MKKTLIRNAQIVNEGNTFVGSVIINDDRIEKVISDGDIVPEGFFGEIIEAEGLWLMPGVIDDQVHFREPGLTHKADIATESRAAVAGGTTSYMEMPNTMPLTVTLETLEDKYRIGAEKSAANYSFYIGATNENVEVLKQVNPKEVCGVKIFMGSSTGNMLVDNATTLSRIFAEIPMLITTHCEDEASIRSNIAHYKALHGDDLPLEFHPIIRDAEVCYRSSSLAVELATRYGARLHVLHLSTEKEMSLFSNHIPLKDKKITAEACIHHLWFNDSDYAKYGNRIKWNPAIKSENDRLALIKALNNDLIDVVATDHAPHLLREKEGNCLKAASGGPLVQHSLVAMLQLAKQGAFSVEQVVRKMCHAPAELYRVVDRGYIRQGYYADLVLVNPNKSWTVNKTNILAKCGWSPFENTTFDHQVVKTIINGKVVYNDGVIDDSFRGQRLTFY